MECSDFLVHVCFVSFGVFTLVVALLLGCCRFICSVLFLCLDLVCFNCWGLGFGVGCLIWFVWLMVWPLAFGGLVG